MPVPAGPGLQTVRRLTLHASVRRSDRLQAGLPSWRRPRRRPGGPWFAGPKACCGRHLGPVAATTRCRHARCGSSRAPGGQPAAGIAVVIVEDPRNSRAACFFFSLFWVWGCGVGSGGSSRAAASGPSAVGHRPSDTARARESNPKRCAHEDREQLLVDGASAPCLRLSGPDLAGHQRRTAQWMGSRFSPRGDGQRGPNLGG
jgi:hypothetical protein